MPGRWVPDPPVNDRSSERKKRIGGNTLSTKGDGKKKVASARMARGQETGQDINRLG